MDKYYWIIDRDVIGCDALALTGPAYPTEDRTNAAKFRMRDDDGVVYFYGRIFGEYEGFEPLDDFGMPCAGCVDIQYKVEGEWTSL